MSPAEPSCRLLTRAEAIRFLFLGVEAAAFDRLLTTRLLCGHGQPPRYDIRDLAYLRTLLLRRTSARPPQA